MAEYKTRKDVPLKYQWDLSDIASSTDDFRKQLKKCLKDIASISSFVGCTKNAKSLIEYLEFDISLGSRIMNLEIYAMTMCDSDLSNSEYQAMVGEVEAANTTYGVNNAFFEVELLNLEKDEYKKLFDDKELLPYKPYLDNLYRFKDHVLSENEEKIVNKLTKTLSSYSKMSETLLNSNHNYGTVTLDDGEIVELMSTNYRKIMKKLSREKREQTYYQFNRKINEYLSTNASLLNNYVVTHDALTDIYHFENAWDRKLFSLKLSDKVFSSLISVCEKRKNSLKKYYDLRKRVLGLDEVKPWDMAVDLVKSDKTYTIEEAQELVIEALKPLGEDYLNHLKVIFDKRCIDYCQYKGKTSGGYNVSGLDLKNSRILMSFNEDLLSVSTIIHEAGHHVNHQYLYEENPPLYRFHNSIVSEVASLTNECLLSYYLKENGSKEEALLGLNNIIDVIYSNLFDAVLEGTMEKEFHNYVHEGGVLTKEYLNNLSESMQKRFLPKENIIEEETFFWARRSHYYMYFYLFSYAICISVALYVSREIFNGNTEMLDNYLKYLKTGSNVDVEDVFKILGINLEDENVYNKAIDTFEELIDDFIKRYEEV